MPCTQEASAAERSRSPPDRFHLLLQALFSVIRGRVEVISVPFLDYFTSVLYLNFFFCFLRNFRVGSSL
jgi:hypothetical protein